MFSRLNYAYFLSFTAKCAISIRLRKFSLIRDLNGPKRKDIRHNVIENNGKSRTLLVRANLWQLVDEIMEITSMGLHDML